MHHVNMLHVHFVQIYDRCSIRIIRKTEYLTQKYYFELMEKGKEQGEFLWVSKHTWESIMKNNGQLDNVHFMPLLKKCFWTKLHPSVFPYPEAFLLVGFDVTVKVFQSAVEATEDQILPHMFVRPLNRWPHGALTLQRTTQ